MEARRFQKIGRYETPSLPPEKAIKRVLDRARTLIFPGDGTPIIEASDLDLLGRRELDEIAAPPACGPLMDGLTLTFGPWLEDPGKGRPRQLVILPPCDDIGLLAAWGRDKDLHILERPQDAFAGAAVEPDLSGDGVLVIPALEAWFLRRMGGLDLVRRLLSALGRTDRRCLVDCNSWAWPYLCKAADAGALFPAGLTFQAFDGPRLQHWFGDLSREVDAIPATFRLSGSGTDVFAEEAEGRQNYFVQLAAQSLGIPWVAWRMWRDALRDAPAEEDEARYDHIPQDEGRTYWIVAPETFSLPLGREEDVIMTLHALLLHGEMTEADLASVLPLVGARNTVPSLRAAGLIRRAGDTLRCNPVAYPSIRSALSDAGLNLDTL